VAPSPLLARYDAVLLDLDGCLWVGEEATRDAPGALDELRAAGKAIAFITNDSRASGEELVRKLWRLGFRAALDEVVTVGAVLQGFLLERHAAGTPAFVIGSEALREHVAAAGLRVVNGTPRAEQAAVVVIGTDVELRYDDLRVATQAALAGAALVGACRDATFPMTDGPWPGTGAVLAAVETASGRQAAVVGKPEPDIFLSALERVATTSALVIGDRLDSDLAGAHAAGLDCAIVLSGATGGRAAAEARDPAPVAVGADLATLVLGA
jgi:HAD superfamily hydrolase (TIGR01450 family)